MLRLCTNVAATGLGNERVDTGLMSVEADMGGREVSVRRGVISVEKESFVTSCQTWRVLRRELLLTPREERLER